MDKQQLEQRAAQAKSILDNPLFQEAFENIKQKLMIRWENSLIAGKEEREMVWFSIQMLKQVESDFRSFLIIQPTESNSIV